MIWLWVYVYVYGWDSDMFVYFFCVCSYFFFEFGLLFGGLLMMGKLFMFFISFYRLCCIGVFMWVGDGFWGRFFGVVCFVKVF